MVEGAVFASRFPGLIAIRTDRACSRQDKRPLRL
jgi:hypothetical protein